MTTKTFDCVAMKRRGAAHLRARVEEMTREERLAFWAKETEKMRREAREDSAGEGRR